MQVFDCDPPDNGNRDTKELLWIGDPNLWCEKMLALTDGIMRKNVETAVQVKQNFQQMERKLQSYGCQNVQGNLVNTGADDESE